jgi:hypothetical protein
MVTGRHIGGAGGFHVTFNGDNGSTRLLRRLRTSPDELSFVHLAHPDRAGHAAGFMSARYLAAVRAADTQLRRILDAVRADKRLREHAAVILTADHGGRGAGHSDATKRYNYTVPFMVWGVGVAHGRNLYDLNPRAARAREPGGRRTPARSRCATPRWRTCPRTCWTCPPCGAATSARGRTSGCAEAEAGHPAAVTRSRPPRSRQPSVTNRKKPTHSTAGRWVTLARAAASDAVSPRPARRLRCSSTTSRGAASSRNQAMT